MARTRKLQSTPETAEAGIKEIMATSVEKTLEEAAIFVNVSVFKLQEMFCDRIGTGEPSGWDTVPTEYESILDEFKQQMDAAATVKPYTPQLSEVEPQPEAPEQEIPPVIEPSLLQDEPEAPKPKKSSRKSSALTKKKTEAIAQGRTASKQTNQGVKQVLAKLQAQEGIKDAANAGTTYLQAFQATLNQVKGEGLTVLAAEMLQGLSAESDFTPDEILCELGVSLSTETQQALLGKLTPVLGKSELATQEILATAWGNGIDLDAELSQLTNLLNSED